MMSSLSLRACEDPRRRKTAGVRIPIFTEQSRTDVYGFGIRFVTRGFDGRLALERQHAVVIATEPLARNRARLAPSLFP